MCVVEFEMKEEFEKQGAVQELTGFHSECDPLAHIHPKTPCISEMCTRCTLASVL